MSDEPTEANPDSRQSYFALAKSWADDRNEAVLRSRRIAWIVAGTAAAIAVMEALALIALTPLKAVVPYTLLVDRNTGFVQVLEGTHAQTIKPNAALTQSLLAQYVIARESFEIDNIGNQYRKAALWSAGNARRDYLGWISKSNPNSPLNRYPRSTIVSTQVESVSPIAPQTALVRFRTERRNANQVSSAPAYWVAVLRYRYSSEPLTVEDRITNPLGFQVVHYRRDQEAPPPDNVPALDRASAVPPAPAQPAARATIPAQPSRLVGPDQRQQPNYYYGDGL